LLVRSAAWDYSRIAADLVDDRPMLDLGTGGGEILSRLPFRDGAFGLVIDRYESFRASEVARILAPGGHFVTQQVDLHWADDFRSALGLPVDSRAADSWLPLARQQLRAAGLVVQRAGAAAGELSFTDIGALAYYLLNAVVWIAPEAGLPASRAALEQLHERMRDAPFTAREPRFLLVARKP
jgi:SAM-dependent methyltransferase